MKFFSPYICICICICIWYYMFPNTRKTFLRIARFYWDSRRWARNFLHVQEPHSRAPYFCIPHPKYRERAGGREKVQCGFNFWIFAFFVVFFGIGREGGREGKCAILYRNDVRTLPSRRAVHGGGRRAESPIQGMGISLSHSKLKPSFELN
jgi:hypothetical protein